MCNIITMTCADNTNCTSHEYLNRVALLPSASSGCAWGGFRTPPNCNDKCVFRPKPHFDPNLSSLALLGAEIRSEWPVSSEIILVPIIYSEVAWLVQANCLGGISPPAMCNIITMTCADNTNCTSHEYLYRVALLPSASSGCKWGGGQNTPRLQRQDVFS